MTKAAAALLTALATSGTLAVAALPAAAGPAPSTTVSAAGADHGDRGRNARCARELTVANAAFDRAFFARGVDTFIDFYTDDATIIYFNGTRPYTKEEARANSVALSTLDWTASFEVLKTTVQGCASAQVIEDGHFTINGVTSHFLVGLSWVREHGRWRVQVDQGSRLPS